MNHDSYLYVIIALLPLAAGLLVTQPNPYHALILRGVLGAIAAMVDALLGAADVALTEALMGTMLAIALYAVAVRSSLVMRLGIITEEDGEKSSLQPSGEQDFAQLLENLRSICRKRYMRLELVSYTNPQALQRALIEKEVHAICTQPSQPQEEQVKYHTQTRIPRLYDIMQTELSTPGATLSYVNIADLGEEKL
ncbi:DUF4040 domain-containing protein [Calothrix sp. 336/3]|uniref:DUF4040 domain-containing protein n=1 Tax=Calothrix sp. 336/3 TaxID=1337936 RepID=UPI0004E3B85C|nr:DUF4040 domain-containing protein [Calothrix sp. 336/3]AKG21533.1 hypothetical protein IJ00_09810 [Calothrix sp. 336/3]